MSTRAIARATIVPLLQDARPSATQISQLLRGHPAEIVDRSGAWVRVRGIDQYEGWCHQGYLSIEPVSLSPQLVSAWTDERRMSLGSTVRTAEGDVIALPLGAMLAVDEVVVTGLAMNHRGRSRYFAPIPELLCQRSMELFVGTPYQWGGVTPWGADCSGFVQTMFALHGTQLPRDAWQQAEMGAVVKGELSELRPADLLFFSDREDGKMTHVGIGLGGSKVVHCSLANGGYGVNDLNASDPVAANLRATFQFAKRVL
jgi:hypothetical protein